MKSPQTTCDISTISHIREDGLRIVMQSVGGNVGATNGYWPTTLTIYENH